MMPSPLFSMTPVLHFVPWIPWFITACVLLVHLGFCVRRFFQLYFLVPPTAFLGPLLLGIGLLVTLWTGMSKWWLLLYLPLCYVLVGQIETWSLPGRLRKEFERIKGLADHPPEFLRIEPTDFSFFDHAACEHADREMTALGFRDIGLFRNMTVTKIVPNRYHFIRNMLSADGTILGMFEHVYGREWGGQPFLNHAFYSFATEFGDGSCLETNTMLNFNFYDRIDGMTSLQMPEQTNIDELFRIHNEAVAAIGEEGGPRPIILRDTHDLERSDRRKHALFQADRVRKGYITEEEFIRMLGQINHALLNIFRKVRTEFFPATPGAELPIR